MAPSEQFRDLGEGAPPSYWMDRQYLNLTKEEYESGKAHMDCVREIIIDAASHLRVGIDLPAFRSLDGCLPNELELLRRFPRSNELADRFKELFSAASLGPKWIEDVALPYWRALSQEVAAAHECCRRLRALHEPETAIKKVTA
jgi:hypothetical protein